MKLRFGIVGCGVIHGTHAEALQGIESAEVAGFYDVLPDRACAAEEKYGAPAFPSLESMFDAVDAVTICVPSGDHALIGVAAAKAGKHVVCEKPIDVTLPAATAMVEACESAGVKLAVISQHRFANDNRKLHDAAQGGELGPLLAGDMYNKWYRTQAYYDSGAWRGTWKLDGGGCLMNQGVHYIDLLQWIMGGVASVQAQVRTAAHERIEVEDIANVLVEYKNGAVGVIQGSTSYYPGLSERLEVHGKWGTAVLEADRIKVWEVDKVAAGEGLYGRGVDKQPTPNVPVIGDVDEKAATGASDPTAIWGGQHQLQLEDFIQAVADDRDPYLTGRGALKPLKVILAIYESGRRGGAKVNLDT